MQFTIRVHKKELEFVGFQHFLMDVLVHVYMLNTSMQ